MLGAEETSSAAAVEKVGEREVEEDQEAEEEKLDVFGHLPSVPLHLSQSIREAAPDQQGLPPCSKSDEFWLASCRPTGCMNKMAEVTYLFQPDTRRFCLHGAQCPLVNDADHSRIYLHATVEQFNQDRDVGRSVKTLVANSNFNSIDGKATGEVASELPGFWSWSNWLDPKPLQIPHVDVAWRLDRPPLLSNPELTGTPQALPHGKRVVVFVHGFRKRYFHAIANSDFLKYRLDSWIGRSGGGGGGGDGGGTGGEEGVTDRVVIVPFLWPAHKRVTSYLRAKGKTKPAGERLHQLIEFLNACGNRVFIVSHSLGNRVAANALLADTVDLARDSPLVEGLFMSAAALPASALNRGGEFPADRLRTPKIAVFHSRNDPTLGTSFAIGESVPALVSQYPHATLALGLVGPLDSDATPPRIDTDTASPSPSPPPPPPSQQKELSAKVRAFDVSADVSGHSQNLWTASDTFINQVAVVMFGAS